MDDVETPTTQLLVEPSEGKLPLTPLGVTGKKVTHASGGWGDGVVEGWTPRDRTGLDVWRIFPLPTVLSRCCIAMVYSYINIFLL